MRIFEFARIYEQIGVEELIDRDVGKTITEAIEMFSGLPFEVVNDCQGLIVRADSLLRQLIYNFIDNSRKYGKKTTTARLHYCKTVKGLVLTYEDDGLGIPLENKKHLFRQGFSTGVVQVLVCSYLRRCWTFMDGRYLKLVNLGKE